MEKGKVSWKCVDCGGFVAKTKKVMPYVFHKCSVRRKKALEENNFLLASGRSGVLGQIRWLEMTK